ncbi:MAG: hypothetical protein OXU42_01505 [Deltaproteobacteria bacterium]|nr:hypothetical protein [Deltaproteobacteria bacterium]
MLNLKSKKPERVSARRFCRVFAKLWKEEVEQNREAIREAFSKGKSQTTYMLATSKTPCECTFLGRLSEKLNFTMARGWYTLDAVYYDKNSSLQDRLGRKYVFPACMDVIIEHENNRRDVGTEMWKLLMWRSPLKVLIFYDNDEADNTWLTEKLKKLLGWCTEVDSKWPEADNTEYLFLVGIRTAVEPLPAWHYAIASDAGSSKTWRISKLKPLPLP